MSAKIIDGKFIAKTILDKLKVEIQHDLRKGFSVPGLAVVLVGDDPASQVYVNNKRNACNACGIHSVAYHLPSDISEQALLSRIAKLNQDPSIQGILIQLPLPKHINASLILDSIDPKKDVDGFHPYNLGLLAQKRPFLRPCTPYGVIRLLAYENIALRGLDAVIVGASNIVGRPMALELLNMGCTTTVCHSATRDLDQYIKHADLLVSAIGKRGIIQSQWLKPHAIVIDVGITRTESGKLHGDIEFETACKSASYITPVPGGVGPMTVAMLLENTVLAAKNARQ